MYASPALQRKLVADSMLSTLPTGRTCYLRLSDLVRGTFMLQCVCCVLCVWFRAAGPRISWSRYIGRAIKIISHIFRLYIYIKTTSYMSKSCIYSKL